MDIYHGLSNELPLALHQSAIKSVVTIHDLIFMRYPRWYKPIDRVIYKNKFGYSSRIADRIIAISKQTKSDLVNYLNIDEKKIEVIYQGCNESFRQVLSENDKLKVKEKWQLPEEYILYVGTIEERKNLLSVIKSLHLGKISVPLIVVGRQTGYYGKIRKYIDQHSLKQIHFLKEVPVTDLPGIYQMASLFIYPSVFEGFGIPVLEALYSRIPVITSKGGCFCEVGGELSVYVDPGDIDEIIDAIVRILTNKQLRDEMKDTGYTHAQQFSNERIAGQIMALYKRLLNE
ncbi:D-inositol-3-phosphate glycosyltransferase [subsurface metagenome]